MARKKPMKTVPTQFELMRSHSKQEGIHPQSQAQGSGRMTLLYTDVKEE